MNRLHHISLVLAVLLLGLSCTTARWTVKNKKATDRYDYKVTEQYSFLRQSAEVTPENPVLQLNLLRGTKYRYAQKVLAERSIQKYRLRPALVALGLAGAATAFYAANTNGLQKNQTSGQSLSLNAAGLLLAASGFLNLKPTGPARPTGEERLLRTTGHELVTDTLRSQPGKVAQASILVSYNGKTVFEEKKHTIRSSQLKIPLANKFNDLQIDGPNPGNVNVEITFTDSLYSFHFPIPKILVPYAQITSQLTELRNSPEQNKQNVVVDLVKGSKVTINGLSNKQWYKVSYGGMTENYINKDDAYLIWRSSDILQDQQIVAIPQVPFGNIDVESNIPILKGYSPNSAALIVTNEHYKQLPDRNYSLRDGKLIKEYLTNALGFPTPRVQVAADTDVKTIDEKLAKLAKSSNDSTDIVIYLSGYGTVNKNNGQDNASILMSGDSANSSKMNLQKLFKKVSNISSAYTLVISDLDFTAAGDGKDISANQGQNIMSSLASTLAGNNPNASLLSGSNINQVPGMYFNSSGEDKKHNILPYFIAKALQKRHTTLSSIYQYLLRNVSYTSRKLHDRPQDPTWSGNLSIDLVK